MITERMSGADALMLYLDRAEAYNHTIKLSIIDPSADPDGGPGGSVHAHRPRLPVEVDAAGPPAELRAEGVEARLGPVTVLVNNAAIRHEAAFADIPIERLDAAREWLAQQSEAVENRMAQGNLVGAAAQRLYPEGRLIEHVFDLGEISDKLSKDPEKAAQMKKQGPMIAIVGAIFLLLRMAIN